MICITFDCSVYHSVCFVNRKISEKFLSVLRLNYSNTANRVKKMAAFFLFKSSRNKIKETLITAKKQGKSRFLLFGAGGRGRTGTVSLPLDFESSTSANSITPAGGFLTLVYYNGFLSKNQQEIFDFSKKFGFFHCERLPFRHIGYIMPKNQPPKKDAL